MGFLYQNSSTNNQLLMVTDSLGLVGGNSNPISDYLTLPNFQGVGWDKHFCGTAGINAATQLRDPNSENGIVERVLPNISPFAPVNLAVVWTLSNGIAQGQTVDQALADYKALCLELKRWGCKVLAMSFISRDGVDGSYIPLVRQEMLNPAGNYYFGNYADAMWDSGQYPPFAIAPGGTYPTGAGARDGVNYVPGGVHQTTVGSQGIVCSHPGYDLNSMLTAMINNTASSLPAATQPCILRPLTAAKYHVINQKDVFDIMTAGIA